MPRGKLALGQNSTEIMSSDKSNSAAMFLRIQTDIFLTPVSRVLNGLNPSTLNLELWGSAKLDYHLCQLTRQWLPLLRI